jgi:hypothetical protein
LVAATSARSIRDRRRPAEIDGLASLLMGVAKDTLKTCADGALYLRRPALGGKPREILHTRRPFKFQGDTGVLKD